MSPEKAQQFASAFAKAWASYERKLAIAEAYQAVADAALAKPGAFKKAPPEAERYAEAARRAANEALKAALDVHGRTGLANEGGPAPRNKLQDHLGARPKVVPLAIEVHSDGPLVRSDEAERAGWHHPNVGG